MDEINVILTKHDQNIKSLQHQINELKGVQEEIKSINEILVTLTNELKHTNEHLKRHEKKIEEFDNAPKNRLNQIITAIISALAGGFITAIIASIITYA